MNLSLAAANDLLGNSYKPLDSFVQFDNDDVPTNSDITFVLTSYLEEIERMRSDNIEEIGGGWKYLLSDSEDIIWTAPPRKIKEKK